MNSIDGTESDIIFAEICLELVARVRILMREPVGRELERPPWPFSSPQWNARFHKLVPDRPWADDERREIWFDSEELGPLVEGSLGKDAAALANHRRAEWLINTAEMEAEPVTVASGSDPLGGRLHGVLLWTGDPTEEQALLIKRVNSFNGYRGQSTPFAPQAT
jgi:hypothetical protein